jgi:transposase-like protein
VPRKPKVNCPVHESNPSLAIAHIKSETITQLRRAIADEATAVDFFERQRWPEGPACMKCGSVAVYKMMGRDGNRQKHYRWRCKDCSYQFTVRTDSIWEDSKIPMHQWAHAVWLAAAGKKGVAALELCRILQIQYKSALFMMHRLRWAMAEVSPEPLTGVVEVDEKYCGGKPRKLSRGEKEKLIAEGKEIPVNKRGRGTKKVPVVAAVQRDGKVRSRVVANVNGANLKEFMTKAIDPSATVCTDELNLYPKAAEGFAGHHTTHHGTNEYARTDEATGLRVHSNTAESNFALLQRSLIGVYHNVSDKHLHRYVSHSDFMWNSRKSSDGDRVTALIRAAEGKRLFYREPATA